MSEITLKEVSRQVDLATGITTIIYDQFDGEEGDPATAVTRWASLFLPDAHVPEDLTVPDHPYHSYFDGLSGAKSVRLHRQDADREARDMKSDQKAILDTSNRRGRGGVAPEVYEDFLAAIEAYRLNPDDDEAWSTIESFRMASLKRADVRER